MLRFVSSIDILKSCDVWMSLYNVTLSLGLEVVLFLFVNVKCRESHDICAACVGEIKISTSVYKLKEF